MAAESDKRIIGAAGTYKTAINSLKELDALNKRISKGTGASVKDMKEYVYLWSKITTSSELYDRTLKSIQKLQKDVAKDITGMQTRITLGGKVSNTEQANAALLLQLKLYDSLGTKISALQHKQANLKAGISFGQENWQQAQTISGQFRPNPFMQAGGNFLQGAASQVPVVGSTISSIMSGEGNIKDAIIKTIPFAIGKAIVGTVINAASWEMKRLSSSSDLFGRGVNIDQTMKAGHNVLLNAEESTQIARTYTGRGAGALSETTLQQIGKMRGLGIAPTQAAETIANMTASLGGRDRGNTQVANMIAVGFNKSKIGNVDMAALLGAANSSLNVLASTLPNISKEQLASVISLSGALAKQGIDIQKIPQVVASISQAVTNPQTETANYAMYRAVGLFGSKNSPGGKEGLLNFITNSSMPEKGENSKGAWSEKIRTANFAELPFLAKALAQMNTVPVFNSMYNELKGVVPGLSRLILSALMPGVSESTLEQIRKLLEEGKIDQKELNKLLASSAGKEGSTGGPLDKSFEKLSSSTTGLALKMEQTGERIYNTLGAATLPEVNKELLKFEEAIKGATKAVQEKGVFGAIKEYIIGEFKNIPKDTSNDVNRIRTQLGKYVFPNVTKEEMEKLPTGVKPLAMLSNILHNIVGQKEAEATPNQVQTGTTNMQAGNTYQVTNQFYVTSKEQLNQSVEASSNFILDLQKTKTQQ